jgi:hypothetical protein
MVSAALITMLPGCVGYTTYSLEPGSIAPTGPNSLGVNDVILTGTKWVIDRYPPSGRPNPLREPGTPVATETFALNLPYGLNEESTRVILRQLGPGAQPMLEEHRSLPIYHVAYLRIRGDEADMHVFRPLMVLGVNQAGQPAYQEMRLKLRGGARRWFVEYGLNWTPGTGQAPELNIVNRPREPEEYLKRERLVDPTPETEPVTEEPAPVDAGSAPIEEMLPSEGQSAAVEALAAEPMLLDLPGNPMWDDPVDLVPSSDLVPSGEEIPGQGPQNSA